VQALAFATASAFSRSDPLTGRACGNIGVGVARTPAGVLQLRVTHFGGRTRRWRRAGRTVFHLATSVSVPLFETALAVFASAVRGSYQADRVRVAPGWLAQHAALACA
jgi:hypothetical protein